MSDVFDMLNTPELDPIIVRRSILETTCSCPYQAMMIREGKAENGGYLAEVGNEGHEVIKDAVSWAKSENGTTDKDELIKYIEEELPKARPDLQPEVLRSMRGIAKTLRRIPVEKIVSVEKQYSHDLMGATKNRGKVTITCCMDLVLLAVTDTELHVHDWKTGFKKRSNSDVLTEFQTAFYCTVLFKVFPELERIHFWYEQTRFGDRVYGCADREKHLPDFEMRVFTALKDYLSESKEARPDVDKCTYCCCIKECPHANAKAREINDDVSEYFAQYIALTARVKEMKDVMNAYCKVNEEITYNDNVYGYVPPKRVVTFKAHKKKKDTN